MMILMLLGSRLFRAKSLKEKKREGVIALKRLNKKYGDCQAK